MSWPDVQEMLRDYMAERQADAPPKPGPQCKGGDVVRSMVVGYMSDECRQSPETVREVAAEIRSVQRTTLAFPVCPHTGIPLELRAEARGYGDTVRIVWRCGRCG